MEFKATLLDEVALNRALFRISNEIIERNKGVDDVVLIGIYTRGVEIANKVAEDILKIEGKKVKVGYLNITLYRDDLSKINVDPILNQTEIDFSLENQNVVLLDDVIYTGRTVRAALDALSNLGRPKTIQLGVLVDRGHRELPIRPDYVGKNIPTSTNEVVAVKFKGIDEATQVDLYRL